MKYIFALLFLSVVMLADAQAQSSETLSELTPAPANFKNFKNFSRQLSRLPEDYHSIINGKIKFDVQTEVVKLTNNQTAIAITIQTTNDNLIFASIDDKITSRINIYGQIVSDNKTIDGIFTEFRSIEFRTVDEVTKAAKNQVIIRKMFALPQGKYKIGIMLADISGDIRGTKFIKFQIL